MKRADGAAFLLIAAIVVYSSMIPPVVSLGNNGDFGKISGHFSFGYPPEQEYHYAPLKFHYEPRYNYHPSFRSTENLLAILAVGLSAVVSKTGEFDIRCLGAIHAALFLLAIWLLLPVLAHFFRMPARVAILLVIAAVFGDVIYVSVFNSFYMDASALVFIPLTLVFFLRSVVWRRNADLIGLAISATLTAGAKPQHAILALPIILLLISCRKRLSWVVWPAAGGVILAASWTTLSVPPDYRANQWYDVIFLGLLPYSPTPAQDLAELGLDPAYVSYSRTSAYYSTGGFAHAEFAKDFRTRMSAVPLLRFYMRHPVRTFQLLIRALDDAGKTRPGMGNFDPAEGLPPDAQSHAFAEWSQLRQWLFARHGLRYFWVTLAIQALLLWRASGDWRIAAWSLTIAVLLEAGISGLADAAEAPRHFTVFCQLQDISAVALMAGFLPRVSKTKGGC